MEEQRVYQEVEVGFKIKQNQKQAEKLLKKAGYTLHHTAKVHDIYYTNKELTPDMTEQEIKFSCIRFRYGGGDFGTFFNYKLFDPNAEDKFEIKFTEGVLLFEKFQEAGFKRVIDTYKRDTVYQKDKSYHQLQEIKYVDLEAGGYKDIGLLDYYYDEEIFQFRPDWQFMLLTNGMKNLGFELEYEEGVDKLRSILAEKLCFSKNQNGDYTAQ